MAVASVQGVWYIGLLSFIIRWNQPESEIVSIMRKTKEEMLITRERILKAGFDCFYHNGYEQTSLAAIAQAAGVTRGAIYWHFEDKKALFRAVVDYNIERGDITEYGKNLPAELPYTDRLAEMFWYALNDNPHVEFIFKVMNFAASNPEFADVMEKIQEVKRKLWEFIDVETKVYMRLNGKNPQGTECMASTLSLMFEGMFLMKNVEAGIKLDKEHVYKYTSIVTASLIFDTQPQRWEKMHERIIS